MAAPAADATWAAKYRVHAGLAPPPGGAASLTVYDFSAAAAAGALAPADLAAVAAAEAAELAARPATVAAATAAIWAASPEVPRLPLRDGTTIPAIGLGTWKAERGQVRAAVYAALRAGYRHIDCASVYANEDEVGDALAAALAAGFVARDELFITSKVWNNAHSAAGVRASLARSLAALKLDYLDLFMIHWPVTGSVGPELNPSTRETWRAMEALVREGRARSLGVSNFGVAKMAEVEAFAEMPLSVCQVEIHPYHRNDALLAWCAAHRVHVTAFSPLGSPDSASIFPRRVPAILLEDPVVKAVAQITGKNAGQVLIRWALEHGTSVIPKSVNLARLRGNLDVLAWALPPRCAAALGALRFQQRMVNGAPWLHARGPYCTMAELWDEEEVDVEFDREGAEADAVALVAVCAADAAAAGGGGDASAVVLAQRVEASATAPHPIVLAPGGGSLGEEGSPAGGSECRCPEGKGPTPRGGEGAGAEKKEEGGKGWRVPGWLGGRRA